MHREIERKFLVRKDLWYAIRKPPGIDMVQGYLVTAPDKTIRVRITENNAWLTIKGAAENAARLEYEFPVPHTDALELLDAFTVNRVEKTRYRIEFAGKTWEIDEFFGKNEGLVIAEIELESENEEFQHPQWLGEEVTTDHRYSNSYLAEHPYKKWIRGELS